MTLTTFAMEKQARIRRMNNTLPGSGRNPLTLINDFLPVSFPGRVIHMEHSPSEYSLRGVIHGRVIFDVFGTEDIDMEICDIAQDFDIFVRFAKCITERLAHLEEGKRKHLSTLVNNLYKGVV